MDTAQIPLRQLNPAAGKNHWPFIALLGGVALFYFLTLQPGHDWGDDFAMMIHHAKNIAEGRAYRDTGYIPNPQHPGFSPDAYPPVFPLLLSPVYRLFGMNFTAMKVECILFFLASLVVFYLLFLRTLSPGWATTAIALMALHPYFWDFRNKILADTSFLFFLGMSFLMLQTPPPDQASPLRRVVHTVVTGVLLYLLCGTKTLGATLLIAIVLCDLYVSRKLTWRRMAPVLLCVFLLAIQSHVLGSDSRFRQDYSLMTLRSSYNNAKWYLEGLCAFWHNGYFKSISVLLFLVLSLFGWRGYQMAVKRRVTPMEVFPWVYLPVIIFYPWNGAFRILMALIPLYVYYIVLAMAHASFRERPIYRYVLGVLFAAIAITDISLYTTLPWGPIPDNVTGTEAQDLFSYIRAHTRDSDIFICLKPRALALFTDRRATVYYVFPDNQSFWTSLRTLGVSYMVESDADFRDYRRFIDTQPDRFILVHSNREFKLWKIKP